MTVFNRRKWYQATSTDLALLKKTFLLANIKVVYRGNNSKSNNKNR